MLVTLHPCSPIPFPVLWQLVSYCVCSVGVLASMLTPIPFSVLWQDVSFCISCIHAHTYPTSCALTECKLLCLQSWYLSIHAHIYPISCALTVGKLLCLQCCIHTHTYSIPCALIECKLLCQWCWCPCIHAHTYPILCALTACKLLHMSAVLVFLHPCSHLCILFLFSNSMWVTVFIVFVSLYSCLLLLPFLHANSV